MPDISGRMMGVGESVRVYYSVLNLESSQIWGATTQGRVEHREEW
jgi:hypothetical protein